MGALASSSKVALTLSIVILRSQISLHSCGFADQTMNARKRSISWTRYRISAHIKTILRARVW
jgi:hypothetical protein